MTSMADVERQFIGGVDTHMDNHVAVVIDELGRVQGTESFPTTSAGYRKLLAWMRHFGPVVKVGVEGTGSYGAGLTDYLTGQNVDVVEVNRPNRQFRRLRGKSDPTDAEAAARAVLSGEASSTPKAKTGAIGAIRALRVARRGAVKASTQASNQLRDLILTAPEALRARMDALPKSDRIEVAARFRPGAIGNPIEDMKAAMRAVACRHQELAAEIAELDRRLAVLVEQAAPEGLLEKTGVATQVASVLLVTPATTRSDWSPRPASPRCVGRVPSMRRRGSRFATGSIRVGTARPSRPLAHRLHPHAVRPENQALCGTSTGRRQDQQGDHPLPEALHRP